MKEYIKEKVNELIAAPSCCAEAKAAANNWLNCIGTEKEKAAAEALVKELEADLLSVDQVIAFTGSEAGKKVFGEDTAKKFFDHAVEIKAAGAEYCDCPACTAAKAILDHKNEL